MGGCPAEVHQLGHRHLAALPPAQREGPEGVSKSVLGNRLCLQSPAALPPAQREGSAFSLAALLHSPPAAAPPRGTLAHIRYTDFSAPFSEISWRST